MDAGAAAALRAWLPRVTGGAPARLDVAPHGSAVAFRAEPGQPPRRVAEADRRGTLVATLRWTAAGRLAGAAVRIPDGSWVVIEPRAAGDAPWGASDRLWHAPAGTPPEALRPAAPATPLTVFAALDYARIDRIPALAEPRRLGAGAGTALLNLIAGL
ncbi:MAG TPA: hypothetical protein VFX28_16765, partial [Methylomirabilota bacterium]|nr:hypothetical protein [Methylomirabilota bacterium]